MDRPVPIKGGTLDGEEWRGQMTAVLYRSIMGVGLEVYELRRGDDGQPVFEYQRVQGVWETCAAPSSVQK